jgi:hypothetical protein
VKIIFPKMQKKILVSTLVPTPSNGPSNGFARLKIIKSKRHIKNRYIGQFMYMSFAFGGCVAK